MNHRPGWNTFPAPLLTEPNKTDLTRFESNKRKENMSDNPISLTPPPEGYADWLSDLKDRIHTAQQRATLAVNRELVLLICIDPSSN